MIIASQARLNKGYVALASLDKQCFQLQFQDISTKIRLFHTLVTPIFLYGCEVWGPSLRQLVWSCIERVLISMLSKFIHSKRIVLHPIILAKFGIHPLFTTTIFHVVSLLCRFHSMLDMRRYPYLAMHSSIQLANQVIKNCWYA